MKSIRKRLFPTDGHIKSSRSTGQSLAIEAIPTSVFCGGTRDLEAVPSDGFQGFQAAPGEGEAASGEDAFLQRSPTEMISRMSQLELMANLEGTVHFYSKPAKADFGL